MLQNQLGRRNLSDFQRVEIVRKYEEAVKAQAEQRMLAGKADPKVNLPEGQKSRKQSRDELGTLAGVSGSTYEHATKVIDHAPTTIVNAARNNQISIHAAYEITKLPVPQQSEIAQRIEQGEPAKSVISEVRSRNRKPKTDTTTANTADDIPSKSAASETSFHNEELNVQHEANPATMNEEKQPKEVSTTQEAQTQHKEIQEQLQQDEVSEHSDNETLQPSQNKQHYERATQYDLHDYEEESNPNDYDDDERDVFEEYNQYEEYSRISIYKTDLRYNIIYAEPDWDSYQSTEELLTLPVGRVAEKNCALLMWVNAPRLHEAQEVIKQWGFSNEKIAFVWVKTTEDDNGQQSYYLGQSGDLTRENVEFCLIATKGTIQRVNDNIPQGVLCPIEKEKPDYVKPELFKELTVQLLGNLPTLELFPDPYALDQELQFSTTYNGKRVEWDMAAPKVLLEQLAEDRRIEINM